MKSRDLEGNTQSMQHSTFGSLVIKCIKSRSSYVFHIITTLSTYLGRRNRSLDNQLQIARVTSGF